MNRIFQRALIAAFVLCASAASAAFPDRPVRIIVPYPAGGATDAAARLVADRLGAMWQQPVTVENRPGAQGVIGTELAAKAPADGHTLLLQVGIIISTELMRPSVNYRVLRDFQAVTTVFSTPIVYVASNGATQGNLKEVFEAAKRDPAFLNYGSHGDGTTTNYMGEALKRKLGIEMVHAPFNGDGPILAALLGGHLKTGFLAALNGIKAQDSGRARMLAVGSAKRSPLIPNVPTFLEQGIEGFDRESWGIVFVPKNTPDAVVQKLSVDISRVVKSPEIQKSFRTSGLVEVGGTPAQTQQVVQSDYVYWLRQIREFGSLGK